MAEELQNLIDRIQKDGVDKAEAEAEKIVSAARKKAEETVKQAEEKAAATMKQAEQDAGQFMDRSKKTLQQAARDVIIAIGQSVDRLFKDLISDSLDKSLSAESVMETVVAMSKAYVEKGFATGEINLLVNPDDQEKLKQLYAQKFKDAMSAEVVIGGDDSIVKGFKISFKEGRVYHDFTQEAIADSLMTLVRPELGKIVQKAASEQSG